MKGTTTDFAQRCKLTCLGGSEVGTCSCARPIDCQLQNHPAFVEKRLEATARAVRRAIQAAEQPEC